MLTPLFIFFVVIRRVSELPVTAASIDIPLAIFFDAAVAGTFYGDSDC